MNVITIQEDLDTLILLYCICFLYRHTDPVWWMGPLQSKVMRLGRDLQNLVKGRGYNTDDRLYISQ